MAADVPDNARIHAMSWQHAYRGQMPDQFLDGIDVGKRARMWRETIADPDKHVLVVEDKNRRVIGFCLMCRSRDDDAGPATAEVSAIYIHPEKWRTGIGRMLLTESVARFREKGFDETTLWVLEGNDRARCFYESFGFVHDGAAKSVARPEGFTMREVRYRLDHKGT
jgi:ribosomal protein S18 acetylase RimI-like enzyme